MSSELELLKKELEKFEELQTRFGNAGAIAGLVVAEAIHRVLTRKVTAQHEETGRMWEGSLDQMPPGYSAVETPPDLGKRCRHNQPADSCDTCYAVDG